MPTFDLKQRSFRWVLLAGAVAPAILAFSIQRKHWINIPIWDEWDTPGLALLRHAQHNLTWQDLFAQHNESRKVIPRLIHLGIASVAGWDVRQGMVLVFLGLCAASAWTLAWLRRPANRSFRQVLVPWLLINLVLFAPSQYENLLSGFTYEILIPFLCLFGCCGVNLSRWPLPLKTAVNSLLALISSYTFAHGILLWILAIPIPGGDGRPPGRRFHLLSYGAYAAIGLLSIAVYFVGYRRPEIAPPLPGLAHIGPLFEFMLVWLGAVLRSPAVNPRLSGAVASLVMAAAVFGAFVVLRKNKERWRAYYPWLSLLAFALGSGMATAIGRVTIGVDSVFNTGFDGFSGMRYNVTSVFAYVAVIGLLFNLYADRISSEPGWRRNFLVGVATGSLLLVVAWLAMLGDELTRVKQFQANRKRARTAVIWSNALSHNPEIRLAYPYPELFWKRIEEMRAAGLIHLPRVSDSLREAIGNLPAAANRENGQLELCEPLPPTYSRFAGWVRDPVRQSAADYVVLGWQDTENSFHPFTAIPSGRVRPDLARQYGAAARKAGFDQDIETSLLPTEAVIIKAWAIDWETQQAFPMEGAQQVSRPHS